MAIVTPEIPDAGCIGELAQAVGLLHHATVIGLSPDISLLSPPLCHDQMRHLQ